VSKEPDAEDRFKQVNEAHDVLRDKNKRAAYDQIRKGGFDPSMAGPQGFQGHGFDLGGEALKDLFENLFGAGFGGDRNPLRQPGKNISAQLEVSLEVAYHGGRQRVSLGDKSLEVKIPAGLRDGQKIRLKGQGGPGQAGGQPGDLVLTLMLKPHHRYEVIGRDLLMQLPLAPWEAALGARIKIQTLATQIELKIPAGARSGQRLRLAAHGMPGSPTGDLLVQLMIQVPAASSKELEAAYDKLKLLSEFEPRSGTD